MGIEGRKNCYNTNICSYKEYAHNSKLDLDNLTSFSSSGHLGGIGIDKDKRIVIEAAHGRRTLRPQLLRSLLRNEGKKCKCRKSVPDYNRRGKAGLAVRSETELRYSLKNASSSQREWRNLTSYQEYLTGASAEKKLKIKACSIELNSK